MSARRSSSFLFHFSSFIFVLLLFPSPAPGQRVDLSIAPASFTFASADPDTTPVVLAPALTFRYRVQQNQDAQWRITVIANGDLEAGGASIPIGNVSWTAAPSPPFQDGTLSASVEQLVASGTGNVPSRTGSLIFRLVNAWTYAAGIYSQTLVFTISAP